MLRNLAILCLLGIVGTSANAASIVVKEYGNITRIAVPVGPNQEWKLNKRSQSVHLNTRIGNVDLTTTALPQNSRLSELSTWSGNYASGIDIVFRCNCETNSFMANTGTIVIDIIDKMEPATTVTKPQAPPAETREAVVQRAQNWDPARTIVATPLPEKRPTNTPPGDDQDASIEALRRAVLEQITDAAELGKIELNDIADGPLPPALRPGCPDESALDFKRLTNTTSFREPIPGLRANILDDMKQINPAAVRALARHFIVFGLGTEARAVLNSFGTTGIGERLIEDMGAFLDGDYEGLNQSALFQEGCGPRAAVWRLALLVATGERSVSENYPQTDGTLFDLPDPLRKILGGHIALGLLDEGDLGTAMRIWRDLENATGPDTSEMRLFAAYPKTPDAPVDAALKPLLEIARTRTPEAIPAALRATEILLKVKRREEAEQLIAKFDDLTFLHQGTKLGDTLALAQAKLNGQYGNLDSALSELQKRTHDEPENKNHLRDVIHETVRAAVHSADPSVRPEDFSTILRAQSMLDDSEKSDQARVTLARKLIDAGAAHLVPMILPPVVAKRSDDARRVVAEAMLLKGQGETALTILGEIADDSDETLKNRAEKMDRSTLRKSVKRQFEAMPAPEEKTSLSSVRELMDGADADLSIIKELMSDG